MGLYLVSKIRVCRFVRLRHAKRADVTASLVSSLISKHDETSLGRNHEPFARIPRSFGLQLHERLQVHTPFPFSRRGKGVANISGTLRILRSDPIYFFGIFISRFSFRGKRPDINRMGARRFGTPRPFAAATLLRYSDFSYSSSPFEKQLLRPIVLNNTSVRISSDRGSLLCGFIIAYLTLLVKGFFDFSIFCSQKL